MTSQFKRRLPVIAKVSQRTIDRDFRYSRDWGKWQEVENHGVRSQNSESKSE